MRSHTVRGGGDVDLHVVETGPGDGEPVLLVHGLSQCRLSWTKQLDSDLADDYRLVAFDNRGHGRSDKPRDGYDESDRWAADVRSVVEALDLDDVVLVAWSYAGLIALDYVDRYGTDRLAGLNLVDAISKIGTEEATALLDPGYLDLLPGMGSTDAEESVAALDSFVRRCVHGDLPPRDRYLILGFNVVVPPHVRNALRDRTVVHDDVLANLDVPVLVTHGAEDRIVTREGGEALAELPPEDLTSVSVYPDAGHTPFWESPERYNRELRAFLADVHG